jgi:hypothetical protein
MNELEYQFSKVVASFEQLQKNIDEMRQLIYKQKYQNPTQLAIIAYDYYITHKDTNSRISMDRVAHKFGSNRVQMNHVKKILKLGFKNLINDLANGNKVNIGTKDNPMFTTNLQRILKYCEKH